MPIARVDYEEPRPGDKLKILLYGMPGSGKTWFAASACACEMTAPALMLSAAGNPQSIWDWDQHPDTFEIGELEDLNQFYDWFAAGQPEDVGMVERLGLNPPYKTLVVDGMTELQRFTLAIAGGHNKLPIGTQPRALQIQEFNPVLAHTVRMAALFFGLAHRTAPKPVHVIITSLEWEKLDIRTQRRDIRPLIWGSGGCELAGYAMSVARMRPMSSVPLRIRKTMEGGSNVDTTVAIWRPLPEVPFNKDQWNRIGDYTVDPSLEKVCELVYGEGEKPKLTTIEEEHEHD
jgi:hypothetical protein